MAKVEALKLARKMFGSGALVRLDPRAFTGDDLRERTAEWVSQTKEYKRANHDELVAILRRRGTILVSHGWCNAVRGYGDTWAEAAERAGLVSK